MEIIKGEEREKGLTLNDYLTDEYFTFKQLWSFTEQIYHIKSFHPNSMLEVGIGNGFVSTFLKTNGIEVTTVDINKNLNPDKVLSVEEVGENFSQVKFDLISCCEVLEHIPFDNFEKIISDFSNISSNLFLTLPMHNRIFGFGGYLKLPKLSTWIGAWIPLSKGGKLSEQHFWELNYTHNTSSKAVVKLLKIYYDKVETSLFKANPSHKYFLCSKNSPPKKFETK